MNDVELKKVVAEVVRRLLAGEHAAPCSSEVVTSRAETVRQASQITQVTSSTKRTSSVVPTTSLSAIGGVSGFPIRPTSEVTKNSPSNSDTLTCDSQLLTLGTFAKGLEGVRHLIIAPKAVITPSLKEELHRRGIEVERRASGRAPQNVTTKAGKPVAVSSVEARPTGRLLVIELDCSQKNHWAKAIAQAAGTIDHLACASLSQALDAVASHVSRGEQLAVILTRQAAAVACAANRNNAVRAAATGSIDTVATVTRSMAANVLAIDPSQHSRHTLQAMTRQFLKAPTREIRTEFEGHV